MEALHEAWIAEVKRLNAPDATPAIPRAQFKRIVRAIMARQSISSMVTRISDEAVNILHKDFETYATCTVFAAANAVAGRQGAGDRETVTLADMEAVKIIRLQMEKGAPFIRGIEHKLAKVDREYEKLKKIQDAIRKELEQVDQDCSDDSDGSADDTVPPEPAVGFLNDWNGSDDEDEDQGSSGSSEW